MQNAATDYMIRALVGKHCYDLVVELVRCYAAGMLDLVVELVRCYAAGMLVDDRLSAVVGPLLGVGCWDAMRS